MRSLPLVLAFFLLSLSGLAAAQDTVSLSDAWARPSMGAAQTGAVFLTLTSSGEEVVIVGAETPVAERAELHTHQMDGAVMRMREVESIGIPAGEQVVFGPGGYHIMLFGMTGRLSEGDSFEITLVTEAGERVGTDVTVKSASHMGPPASKGHMMGGDHMMGGQQN